MVVKLKQFVFETDVPVLVVKGASFSSSLLFPSFQHRPGLFIIQHFAMAGSRHSEVEEERIRFVIKDHPRHQDMVQHGQPVNALNLQSQGQIDAAHDQLSAQKHTILIKSRVGNLRSQSLQASQVIRSPFPRQVFSPALSGYEASSEIDTDVEGHHDMEDGRPQKLIFLNKNDYNNLWGRYQGDISAQDNCHVCKDSESGTGCGLQSLLSFIHDCICSPADTICPCWRKEEVSDDTFVRESQPLITDDLVPSGPFQSPNITQNQLGYQSMCKPDFRHVTAVLKNT